MSQTKNIEQELAWSFILNTSTNIFLTGKAGTGKTTFLKRIVEECPKRKIVVAPTGIAAINAGGVTIHSFFQLPFGVCLPDHRHTQAFSKNNNYTIRKEKQKIIRSLELLIIDEVSMLRADMLDEIDSTLRRIRRNNIVFGGIQVLMIGDMQQLPPVVKNDEWEILKEYYPTPYFFDSIALKKSLYRTIELKHIYRQSEREFIDILAAVRSNKVTEEILTRLNSRFIPNFDNKDSYIILTTHNKTANQINTERLNSINEREYTFKAKVVNNFPESLYPHDVNLVLKCGAQVMFIKNDSSVKRQYVNGTIGKITFINEQSIIVETQDGKVIDVKIDFWEHLKYEIDQDTKEIVSDIDGLFYQFPIRTAWAITIHKSQGLTFDKAIIDAALSFSHGQLYVALSRCRTLDGMILSSKLNRNAVINDNRIELFHRNIENKKIGHEDLEKDKILYLVSCLEDFYQCKDIYGELNKMSYFMQNYLTKLYPSIVEQCIKQGILFNENVVNIGVKFVKTLNTIIVNSDNILFQERIAKAYNYFIDKLVEILLPTIKLCLKIEIDDKDLKKQFDKILTNLLQLSVMKIILLNEIEYEFNLTKYLKAKLENSISVMDMSKKKMLSIIENKGKEPSNTSILNQIRLDDSDSHDIKNADLYERLRKWRASEAENKGVPLYLILKNKSLLGIVNLAPQSIRDLKIVEGIGKKTIDKYGEIIIKIIKEAN